MYEFTKIGRSGGHSVWTSVTDSYVGAREDVKTSVTWYGAEKGESVYVEVEFRGEKYERRGTMHVERAIISNTIIFAMVKSLGDVKTSGSRTVKAEAEEYGSMVAREIVRQVTHPAAVRQEKIENLTAEIRSYAEALGGLSIVESDSDTELAAIVATLKGRLEAKKAERAALAVAKTAVPA